MPTNPLQTTSWTKVPLKSKKTQTPIFSLLQKMTKQQTTLLLTMILRLLALTNEKKSQSPSGALRASPGAPLRLFSPLQTPSPPINENARLQRRSSKMHSLTYPPISANLVATRHSSYQSHAPSPISSSFRSQSEMHGSEL